VYLHSELVLAAMTLNASLNGKGLQVFVEKCLLPQGASRFCKWLKV